MKYDTLCLSGGSFSGICFLGALSKLEKEKLIDLKKIKKFVGSSIGAIFSFVFCIGYTIDDLSNFIYNFDASMFEQDIDLDLIINEFGINNGSRLLVAIQTFLYEKFKMKDITFEELYKKTGKDIGIVVTNYSTMKEEYFSYLDTPKFSVLLSLRMSFSVPFLFTPVKYNKNIYVDGCFLNHFPINYCNPKTTLGLVLIKKQNSEPKNIFDYINGMKNVLLTSCSYKNEKYFDDILVMEGISISLNQPDEMKKKLFIEGEYCAIEFCNNKPEYFIRKILLEIIKEF
tara:strand:- start:2271 stop:3128 length:858 start_codon:yes stop_codon:yes gene_type:complete